MRRPIARMAALMATAAVAVGGVGIAQAGADGGGKPPSAAQQTALAKELGVTAAQLKNAQQSLRPGNCGPGDLAAKLATALDVDVAKVKAILDANRPARPSDGARPAGKGMRPAKPDHTALVAALAKGLGLETTTVKAALDKLAPSGKPRTKHGRGHGDRAAALAKQLGLSTATVQAALDKLRPAKPAATAPGS